MKKTFVISFQKSGTYLISEILENLGYNKTLIHIDRFLRNVHQVYKEKKNKTGEIDFKRFDFEKSPDKIINDLNNNQFAAGHVFFRKSKRNIQKP